MHALAFSELVADSSAEAHRILPPLDAVSSVSATSSAEALVLAIVTAASQAAAASSALTQALFKQLAASTAAASSSARLLTGYAMGDAQAPLPEYGLALTITDVPQQNGTAHPAALYDAFPFNSFAVLDGVAYGLAPDGLYTLNSADEAFTARINLGRRDYGSRTRKVARQIGVARTDGTASVMLSADGGTGYTYAVNAQRGDGRMERAVPGRGLIGTTLEVEVRGDNALAVEEVEVMLDVGGRR